MTWTDNSNNEAGFHIQRSDDNGSTWSLVGATGMNITTYSDVGLLPGHLYQYKVAAWNSLGDSSYAGPQSATTKSLFWSTIPNGAGGPGLRSNHSSVYDSVGQRMLMFGGLDNSFNFYADVWALDLSLSTAVLSTPPFTSWSKLTVGGTPPTARYSQSAIFDALNNRMIIFGGFDTNGIYSNKIYALDLKTSPTWSDITPTSSPAGRMGHTATYDPINQQMIVFGGNDAVSEKGDTEVFYLVSGLWSTAPPTGGPFRRSNHSAIYDSSRERVLIFGGLNSLQVSTSVLNNDCWSLDLTNFLPWASLSVSGPPSFRQLHSAVYDPINQKMVIFGGDTTTAPTANGEMWALNLQPNLDWNFLIPASVTSPAPRLAHSAIYDTLKERMVIFGGSDSSGFAAFGDVAICDF